MIRFKGRSVGFIWGKELLDIVRDRRTLMSMIVMPLLMMPVLIGGIGLIMTASMSKLQERSYKVALVGVDALAELREVLGGVERIGYLDLGSDTLLAREMVELGDVHGAVVVSSNPADRGLVTGNVQLLVKKNRETSSLAMRRVENALKEYRAELVKHRLAEIGASEELLTPFGIREVNLASDEQMAASAMASFLPYILILMTLAGAIYPAIDMTAGEKERGTLETLLASPVGRLEIVLGKFFAVMTTAIVSAFISMISMMLMLAYGFVWLGGMVGEQVGFQFNLGHLAAGVLMMIPLAALFSSLLMTIAVFAKSTREAQSYIVPLNMVIILPAMMSMIPGSESDLQSAWTPVVNVSIVLKEILNGNMDPAMIGITLLSTTLYALAGIFITVRVFQRENVLFRV